MESVSAAEMMLMPNLKNRTNNPSPNRPYTTEGTPARLMIAMRMRRVHQLSCRVFGKVDARGDAERNGEDGGAEHQVEGPDDGGQDAARAHPVARHGGQEFPGDRRDPFDGDIDDDAQDGQDGDRG